MKAPLDTKATAIIVGVAVVALVVAGGLFFKDSFTPAPTVEAKPWSPPGAWSGAPGAGGQAGQGGQGSELPSNVGAPGQGGFGAGRPSGQ